MGVQASTNYKEAFSLFDKRGTGRVALESLGDLLRACGQNPTLAECKELESNVGSDCMLFFFFQLLLCFCDFYHWPCFFFSTLVFSLYVLRWALMCYSPSFTSDFSLSLSFH